MTERPLRYLLMATQVPGSGSLGGVVRYTVGMAAALARRADIELHVLVSGDGGQAFAGIVAPERVHRLPALPTPALSLLERVGLLPGLRGGRFDVVHGTKHIVPHTAAGARRVLTVHDMLLFDRAADYPLLKRLLLRSPYRGSMRDAEVLVAVSEATRSRVTDHLPAVADRVHVAPLAPSPALLEASAEPVAALADVTFALVVGDASARKNLSLAVGTWSRVRERVPGAVLVTVGPQPWGAEDRGGTAWSALADDGAAISLRGISDGALRWCYENAAAVLCPSVLEGFGLPTVEAAALGATVITTEDPALCEAAPGWSRPAASWSPADWIETVVGALRAGRQTAPPVALRTWDDVAADTVNAVRDAAHTPPPALGRVGVSPFRATLRVRHLVAPGDGAGRAAAEALAEAHREGGWKVDIAAPGDDDPAAEADVVVLHGSDAGRARTQLRGRVPTVLLAQARPRNWVREARLARYTNVLALPSDAAAGWNHIGAPITRLAPGKLDADEAAAVIVRALAWGATSRPQETV